MECGKPFTTLNIHQLTKYLGSIWIVFEESKIMFNTKKICLKKKSIGFVKKIWKTFKDQKSEKKQRPKPTFV